MNKYVNQCLRENIHEKKIITFDKNKVSQNINKLLLESLDMPCKLVAIVELIIYYLFISLCS